MLKPMIAAAALSVATVSPALGVGITGPLASEDFMYKYEADVLPDAAGLGFVLSDPNSIFGDTVSLSGGVLTIDTDTNSTANDGIWYTISGGTSTTWDPSFLGNFTLEIRARVNASNSATFGFGVEMNDENSGGLLQLFFNKAVMELDTIPTDPNNDGFHVFRVTSISDGSSAGQTYRIYRDGVQIGTDVAQNTQFPVPPLLRIGDFISGSAEVNVDIDYIRWDTNGAYEPIPEPGSIGLILGGVALVLSRRKR